MRSDGETMIVVALLQLWCRCVCVTKCVARTGSDAGARGETDSVTAAAEADAGTGDAGVVTGFATSP